MKKFLFKDKRTAAGGLETAKRSANKGMAIPLALTAVFIMSVLAYFFISYQNNQDAKTFHIVNIEKSKLVAEGAISAAIFHIGRQMNDFNNVNPFQFIKDIVNIFKSGDASWFARLRIPSLIASAGTTSGTYIPGAELTLTVSPDMLLPPGWYKQTLDISKLPGVTALISRMGGDAAKTKVSCDIELREMKPIVSDKGCVLWKGAKFDESLHDYVNKLGSQLFDFLGIGNLVIDIPVGSMISKLVASSVPPAVDTLISCVTDSLKNSLKVLDIHIDISSMLKSALKSVTNLIHVPDIKPITGNIVIEKTATLFFKCRIDFVPAGSNIAFKTAVEASRDIKIVDMAAANPLYSFYWLNGDKKKYSSDDWGFNHHGIFKLNNISLDYGYTGQFNFPDDIVNFFKGTFTSQIVRFPGLCYIGGPEQQEMPTGLNDILLIYPKYLPIFKLVFGPVGTVHTYMPTTFIPNFPVDVSVLPSFLPSPSIGFYAVGHLVVTAIDGMLKKPKVRLFGDWCLFPTMKLRIDGNVTKQIRSMKGVIFTVPVPFPPCTLKFGGYYYNTESYGYSYAFYQKPAEAKVDGIIENIYEPDQYKKKASLIYKDGVAFNKDSAIRDENRIIKINGVIYVDGDLILDASSFYGAGQLVVNGNLTIKGEVLHLPMTKDSYDGSKIVHGEGGRIVPFVIVCFKKLIISPMSKSRIMAPVYAKEGVETSGSASHIIGNLVCEKFDPTKINADLTIWYTPEITTCSFLSLIPHVGRFAPDRYRAVLAEQFSTFKINRVE